MEGEAQELLTKGISQDDAGVICKDSLIPNGLNGGYELGNGDALGEKRQKNLKNCDSSAEIMEVDSEDNVESANAGGSSDCADDDIASAGEVINNDKSDAKCNDAAIPAAKDSVMDVDDTNDASDIECLGDDDDDDEDGAPNQSNANDCNNSEGDIIEDDVVAAADKDARRPNQGDETVDSSLDTSDLKICEENGSTGSDVQEITEDGEEEGAMIIDNNSDIEEIKPEDPLAVDYSKDKESSKHKSSIKNITTTNNKTTIVVNDTKRLVEIAAGSKNIKGGKKEPTLVIIDTNSILSGKGGVPVSKSSSHHQSSSSHHHNLSSSSSFSMMPIGMGPQQMYGNTRTTITPVPMKSHQLNSNKSTTITPVINPMHHSQQQHLQQHHQPQQQQQQQHQQQILPTLTDDMFVVEAPSFIVPYVYEKPPIKPLKEFTNQLGKSIEEYNKEEKQKRKERREKAIAEGNKVDEDDEETDEEDEKPAEPSEKPPEPEEKTNKVQTYFDLPLGKFFMSIGIGLVQEFVQTDLLRTQKRKASKGQTSAETQMAISSLIKNLEFSKENNEPFRLELKKCEFCNFKTESALVMQHHMETPHMKNYVYKCNHCPIEVRSPHDILYHMEAEHNIRGRLERGPAFHQCPNCPFEDNQKGKLSRHIIACQKKFRPERNLEPSIDWEPPAKIPRLNRPRNIAPQPTPAQLAMAMNVVKGQAPLLPKLLPALPTSVRGRGRPPMQPRYPDLKAMGSRSGSSPVGMRQDNMSSMMYRPASSGLLVPTSYQFSGNNQIFQNTSVTNAAKNPTAKLLSQPSISITPLPRSTQQPSGPGLSGSQSKPGGKSTFVICEICDGYIKDLEQLRNHMQWIHKVKIHPKMIYNRPPLNCQKCQFRFFTDQGLERHLLGSHGLVTSSMQDAANKGRDAGRCPACGRVFQWKLLNHVARDHGMTLKPAHLSYKCTVCTATFGMYKQFENHVYSAHSVVAKRVMDNKKSSAPSSPSSRSNDSLLKPLKINDEITIIPQPAKPTSRSSGSQGRGK